MVVELDPNLLVNIRGSLAAYVVVSYGHTNYFIEQVDILISKNQALQTLYLKHHVYKTS